MRQVPGARPELLTRFARLAGELHEAGELYEVPCAGELCEVPTALGRAVAKGGYSSNSGGLSVAGSAAEERPKSRYR